MGMMFVSATMDLQKTDIVADMLMIRLLKIMEPVNGLEFVND
jgi:hypothetical protein